jgi:hypothetical protein
MKVAIVSDIHGNRRAFEAVLADLGRVAPDLVLHGGDWLMVELTRRTSSIRSAPWGGLGSAEIQMRCFGLRNVSLNSPPQRRSSRRFWADSKR